MKTLKKLRTLLFFILICMSLTGISQNNITVTDDDTHNADASAVLDVYSLTKGMLVPRMTNDQMIAVSNPAAGLLIFNTSEISFFFFNGTIWQNLSNVGENLWSVNGATGDVYLNDLQTNIGIGTDTPLSKLALVANSGANPDDPLFEIQDEFGKPIFSVTSEGVRIYVKDVDSKGISGGFAVGKYGAAKGFPDTTLFMVTPDSTRVYTQAYEKGISGGFAVGKYGAAKGVAENYLHLTEKNYLIGHKAGDSLTSGLYNIFLGYMSGFSDKSGSNNVFIGTEAGFMNQEGGGNVFIGDKAGHETVDGGENTFIGSFCGNMIVSGTGNTFVGNSAGSSVIGNDNTIIGKGSNFAAGAFNSSALGAGAFTDDSNKVRIGNDFVTVIEGAVDFSIISDKRKKENIKYNEDLGLNFIMELKPASYNYIYQKDYRYNGLIAQDVQEAMDKLGLDFSGLVIANNKDKFLSLRYATFVIPLINATQEQQKQIEELQQENSEFKKKINELLKLIDEK